MNPHPSTLSLHQLRLGELEPGRAHLVRAHLATCSSCANRAAHQEGEHAAVRAAPPPAWLDELATPAPEPRPDGWARLAAAWAGLGPAGRGAFVLVPAALLLGLAFGLPGGWTTGGAEGAGLGGDPTELTRVKGAGAALEAWIETGQSARPLYNGERVGPGTRVQLRFNPGGHRFVSLAGRDGRGTVEVYGTLPVTRDGLVNGGLMNAPFALTLDDAPGPQVFYAVLTDTRPDSAELLGSLRRDPARIPGAEVTSVVVPKR